MKLHVGFAAVPYTGMKSPLRISRLGRVRRSSQYGAGKTTLMVAKELEARYKIVETFMEIEGHRITELLEDAFHEDLDNIMTMKRVTVRSKGLSTEETDKIEKMFRDNILRRRYDGIIPGVPTTASLRGVSHRLPHPYSRKNSTRPSFMDTGLYMRSFKAWVTEDDN